MAALLWIFAVCLASLLQASQAGETCGYRWCEHGCCDRDESECCDQVTRIGGIVGLCIGAVVVIVVIIVIILICRRRRHNGIVYRSQPGGTVVVQQGTTTHTGYVTQGMQPGIVYHPYQPYAPQPNQYPQAYPQPVAVGQAYPQTAAVGQAYPPPPQAAVQKPPAYESLSAPNATSPPPYPSAYPAGAEGVVNQGFTEPPKQ
ncbi:hypothetical protein ElyMa_006071500 [Elysia marginata]|uniref:Cysteine and tyrosine-rich protein 1 n=1 Tax=Elysia marginata TaxID=1093978 RepID=A0AAV4GPF1_9GAST|nr:hypothetical protein ElyMa_006071500 [Elysia marginata]